MSGAGPVSGAASPHPPPPRGGRGVADSQAITITETPRPPAGGLRPRLVVMAWRSGRRHGLHPRNRPERRISPRLMPSLLGRRWRTQHAPGYPDSVRGGAACGAVVRRAGPRTPRRGLEHPTTCPRPRQPVPSPHVCPKSSPTYAAHRGCRAPPPPAPARPPYRRPSWPRVAAGRHWPPCCRRMAPSSPTRTRQLVVGGRLCAPLTRRSCGSVRTRCTKSGGPATGGRQEIPRTAEVRAGATGPGPA